MNMKIRQMYVGMLPDGSIVEGKDTAQSAIDALRSSGVEGNIVADDIGTLGRGTSFRTNSDVTPEKALAKAGLRPVSKSEVMSLTPEQAVERIRPLFAFMVSEQRKSVMEPDRNKDGSQRYDADGNPLMKQVNRAVLDKNGQPVYGPTGFVQASGALRWADELMGRNAKLVKDTLNADNATSLRTKASGDLIGLNLYPATKLATEFISTYGLQAEARHENWVDAGCPEVYNEEQEQPFGFNHPISQIISSILNTKALPSVVTTLPMGKTTLRRDRYGKEVEKVEEGGESVKRKVEIRFVRGHANTGLNADGTVLTLSEEHRDNLVKAFPNRTAFTTCASASDMCKRTCLVYTGQNTSAFQNDWKKATCLFALVADPVAYLRLVIHAIDNNGLDAYRRGVPFFVRMNLLSDIPWEVMAPWLFKLYGDAPTKWFKEGGVEVKKRRRNPDEEEVSDAKFRAQEARERARLLATFGSKKRPFPVQFYDYTKVDTRDPVAHGVTNYDLTLSYSGTNFEDIRDALYRKGQRVAVVFAGLKMVRERDGEVYTRALYVSEKKAGGTSAAEDKTASYGYGLPVATDLFAPPELVGTREGFRKIVNADRHDARPLDPPNTLEAEPCISGLAWKSTGGGLTVTEAKKKTFFFAASEMEGGGGWIVTGPEGFSRTFAGRGQKGRAEREARRLTALENIRQAAAFVTPTIYIEDSTRKTFVTPLTGDKDTDRLIRAHLYGQTLDETARSRATGVLTRSHLRGKQDTVVGVYLVAETPRETHVGEDGLSALPGTAT